MPYNEKKRITLFTSPTRVITISFAIVILIGTFLLMLPLSSKQGVWTPFINSLFTATSATCVTGLVVVDTYTHWSLFGQLIILTLIQIGGLGLVTFTSFFTVLIGKKIGLRGMQLAQESINADNIADINAVLKAVVMFAFAAELIGAMLLGFQFVPKYGMHGVYISIFLAISAFCNAGFDILGFEGQYVSLCNYNGSPIVIFTITLLIITGGLGFIVWNDLLQYHKTKRLQFHTKVVLAVTSLLIALGTIMFMALEWNNPKTLQSLPLPQKIAASYFQSVTTRTAGFNTIDIAGLNGETKLFSSILMFIGASSGSTGGGIKITTFAVILMTVICVIKGKDGTIIHNRRVPQHIVYKSLAIVAIAITAVGFTTGVIYWSMNKTGNVHGIDAFFEAVSAFATVGLSVGVSGNADIPSKAALIATMFLGRVGPVSFALALAMRGQPNKNQIMPEGRIIVG